MAPLLTPVGKYRTLESESGDSQTAVERTDDEISEQIEKQDQRNQVEVGESLDTVDDPVAQDVINEVKPDAWQSFRHPDITDVGDDDYQYDPPYTTQGLEQIFVDSEALSNAEIQFTAADSIDREISDIESEDMSNYDNLVYRLELGGMALSAPDFDEKETIATAIAPEETAVAVTFSADCASNYLSVNHLALSNPLVEELVGIVLSTDQNPERLSKIEHSESEYTRPLLSAWGRKGTFATITETGDVCEALSSSRISKWMNTFVASRL